MEEEIWKSIEGYEGLYEISSLGRVRSLNYRHTGKTKVMKPVKNIWGYLQVGLSKNGEKKLFQVHRLVAIAFIDNPLNKPQVNHKDENPKNNRVDNLEWVTAKENLNYGTRNERAAKALINHLKKSKPVLQFTKEGVFVKEFPSTHEAERQTGINNGHISQCCLGKQNSTGGYVWRYAKVEENS